MQALDDEDLEAGPAAPVREVSPSDVLLLGLKSYYYEALRRTTTRPEDMLLWRPYGSCYETFTPDHQRIGLV
jgi:hypothetical protein